MAEEEEEELQAGEGYLCSCGWSTTDKTEFTRHIFNESRKDGKGTHKSRGRVNLQTGEIVMPPWSERTPDQIKASRRAKRNDNPLGGNHRGKKVEKKTPTAARQTDVLATAQQIQLVPRVYTIDFSPIMRAGFDAAVRVWGWRADMPFGNFLDTVIHAFFKEHGITLAGYIVEETEEERLEREAYLRSKVEAKVNEEEVENAS